jgi:aerobic carbon-monoxide dehydrogenase large subunit
MTTIGTPVRRREDYRFLTGQGTYTDDINRPNQLYAYILRSPHANARAGRDRYERRDVGAGSCRGV